MSNHNKTIINMVSSLLVTITNLLIGFILSPYIIEYIGVEANGFVALANKFVMYGSIIVIALNSMAARYVLIAYTQKDYQKANLYYNSVFWGNLFIVALLFLPALILIVRLEQLIEIPADILWDVKILFSFVFLGFFLQTGLPNWDCGTFVTNQLHRTYIPSVFISLGRCLLLCLMFVLLSPHVWFVGLASFLIVVASLWVNAYNTHILTPELHVLLKPGTWLCSFSAIKELVGKGIWNAIQQVGILLLSGINLIMSNVFLGATAMGVFSVAHMLQNQLSVLSGAITQAFVPEMMIGYAKKDQDRLLYNIQRSIKITSVMIAVPLVGVVVMCKDFYSLWVPTLDAEFLSRLTIIGCGGYFFTSGTQILYNVFPTVNKVKNNGIALLTTGFVSSILSYCSLKYTNWGLYGLFAIPVLVCWIKNMVFVVPYAAKYLGLKKTTFFPCVIRSFISTILLIVVCNYLYGFFNIKTWLDFLTGAIAIGGICLFLGMLLFLDKNERGFVIRKLLKK